MIAEIAIMAVVGVVTGAVTGVSWVRADRRQRLRLTAEQYDALDPKKKLESLPPYQKGEGSYRDVAAQPRCEICHRACLHCKKAKRRRERRK